MGKAYHCLWCGTKVASRGDTCSFICYENICGVLALGEPYIKDEDDPPNDLHRQPWARTTGSEDDL